MFSDHSFNSALVYLKRLKQKHIVQSNGTSIKILYKNSPKQHRVILCNYNYESYKMLMY